MSLDLDRSLPELVILDLIIVGLPLHIQDSFNRNTVTSVKIFHGKLKKFELEDKNFESSKTKNFNFDVNTKFYNVKKKKINFNRFVSSREKRNTSIVDKKLLFVLKKVLTIDTTQNLIAGLKTRNLLFRGL